MSLALKDVNTLKTCLIDYELRHGVQKSI